MMPLRILSLLLALLAVATLASAPAGIAQSQEEELSELWKQYPLETRDERPRPVGAGEENGSTAGPPPKQAEPAGPIPLALLFLALALGVVLVIGGAVQGIAKLRERRRNRSGRLGAGAGHLGS